MLSKWHRWKALETVYRVTRSRTTTCCGQNINNLKNEELEVGVHSFVFVLSLDHVLFSRWPKRSAGGYREAAVPTGVRLVGIAKRIEYMMQAATRFRLVHANLLCIFQFPYNIFSFVPSIILAIRYGPPLVICAAAVSRYSKVGGGRILNINIEVSGNVPGYVWGFNSGGDSKVGFVVDGHRGVTKFRPGQPR